MILDSSVFPLSSGSTTFAGLTWEEKSSDFTVAPSKGYRVDTNAGIVLATMPTSSSNGDTFSFWIVGSNQFRLTGSVINGVNDSNFAKKITQNNIVITWTYNNVTGWTWDSSFNSYISDQYIGAATYYQYIQSPSVVNGFMTRNSNNADIFWNLGTNNLTETWTHPATARNLLTVTQSGVRDNNANPTYWGHNIIDNDANVSDINATWKNLFTASPSGHWVQIDFKDKTVSPTRYWLHEASTININNLRLYGSNNGTDFTLIDTPTITSVPFLSVNLTSVPYYRYIRLWDTATNTKAVEITEFCLWGYLQ